MFIAPNRLAFAATGRLLTNNQKEDYSLINDIRKRVVFVVASCYLLDATQRNSRKRLLFL